MNTSGQVPKDASIFGCVNGASETVCILLTTYSLLPSLLPSNFFLLPFCDPGAIRTRGLQLRRLLLYPTELRGQDLFSNERLVPTENVGILKMAATH